MNFKRQIARVIYYSGIAVLCACGALAIYGTFCGFRELWQTQGFRGLLSVAAMLFVLAIASAAMTWADNARR